MNETTNDPTALAAAREGLDRTRVLVAAVMFVTDTVIIGIVLHLVQDMTGFGGDVFRLAALAPALAAVAVHLYLQGAGASRARTGSGPARTPSLLPDAVPWPRVRAHTILGLGAVVLVGLLVLGGLALTGRPVGDDLGGLGDVLLLLGPILLVGSAAQEIGWRGVLQPVLERTWSRPVAVGVTSVLWAAWSLWALALPTEALAVAALAIVALGVLLGYLGGGTVAQRIVTNVVVHWAMAVMLVLLLGYRLLAPEVLVLAAMALAVTAAVFLAMFVVAQRRRAAHRVS